MLSSQGHCHCHRRDVAFTLKVEGKAAHDIIPIRSVHGLGGPWARKGWAWADRINSIGIVKIYNDKECLYSLLQHLMLFFFCTV